MTTGRPRQAVPKKKAEYPTASTNKPEKPAKNLGKSNMTDEKRAYCVAV
jgi:hypothetical protein